MERLAIRGIEPVTWIEREKLDLGAFGKFRRLVDQESAFVNMGFERHDRKVPRVPSLELPRRKAPGVL